jgi:hypothetical protein
VSSGDVAGRTLRRRFTLGSGPLKRMSDRVEFLSRVALALALLLSIPLGLRAGTAAYLSLAATADQQAAARSPQTATLLADAARDWSGAASVPTQATWTTPDAAVRTGVIDAAPGALAGSTVEVWVDGTGRITARPLTDSQVTGQGVVIGALTALGLLIAGMSTHLTVLWLLERRRIRRWEAGWTAVEPLWVTRFR